MDESKEAKKGKAIADGAPKPSIVASKGPAHPPMDPAKFKALSAEIGKALVDGLNKGAARDHPPKP